MNSKSEKELAFLHDLYVATDWGERFAALVDAHVALPKEGRALYVASGTGGHAMALQERAGEKLVLVCTDESEECLELARAKAVTMNETVEFKREQAASLSFPDEQFDFVLGNSSLARPGDLKRQVSELVRVAKPVGTVAWWLPTAASFGEFFSIYWEALCNAGLPDHAHDVERLITELPTISNAERLAHNAGLENVASWTATEEFDYESGDKFSNSPLITDFLLPRWLEFVPESARARVGQELANIIDEERHNAEFAVSVKATVVVGKKSRVQ